MVRPSDGDSAATYDAIVRAVHELVRQLGSPTDLSMRRVAVEAEVSLGTIHYYFPSKDALLEACLDDYYHRIAQLAQELTKLNGQVSGRQFVEEVARRAYRFVRAERGLAVLRRSTSARRGELPPERQKELLGSAIDAAARVLEPHAEVGFEDCRLAIQTMAMTITRFALLTDSEVEHLVGSEAGRAAIEEYVVRCARRLVRPLDG